jgi:uncharacterized protein with GYD domain
MAHYLLEVAYTPEAWAAQIKSPQNRIEIVGKVLERLGGRFEQTYFAFGDYDIIAFMELPDNVSAAAFSLAVHAGGAVSGCRTTPLMTVEEGIAAIRKAGELGYQPPSA